LQEEHERHRRELPAVVSMIIGITMVVLYIGIGTTIVFKASYVPNIPVQYAQWFGALLIVYGIFRGYKVYRKHFSGTDSDSNTGL
jgi:hypothetical protein